MLAAGLLALPLLTHASVCINEIAWMGTATSSFDEWLELYNDGSTATRLDGWTLTDSGSLSIILTGTLAPHAYAVLERTNDDSAPGKAFLIYTGALSNSGKTLTLTNTRGTVEDEVVGGANWKNIGGDNSTKHTAQRTDSGWVTAPPTPGKANETTDDAAKAKAKLKQSLTGDTAGGTVLGTSSHSTASPFLNQQAEVIGISGGSHDIPILTYVLFAGVVGLGVLGIYGGKFGSKS
jgi:hypothetical protein